MPHTRSLTAVVFFITMSPLFVTVPFPEGRGAGTSCVCCATRWPVPARTFTARRLHQKESNSIYDHGWRSVLPHVKRLVLHVHSKTDRCFQRMQIPISAV